MNLVRHVSPLPGFRPVLINITDLNATIKVDLFNDCLEKSEKAADISISSESLVFIFKNTFGFDTLTVNGCLEEVSEGGFSRATRTLAIENLNNMGIEFRPQIVFNLQLIVMFISRLWAVSKKIKLSRQASS